MIRPIENMPVYQLGELTPSIVALANGIVTNAPPGALRAAKRHLDAHAAYDWERAAARKRLAERIEAERYKSVPNPLVSPAARAWLCTRGDWI